MWNGDGLANGLVRYRGAGLDGSGKPIRRNEERKSDAERAREGTNLRTRVGIVYGCCREREGGGAHLHFIFSQRVPDFSPGRSYCYGPGPIDRETLPAILHKVPIVDCEMDH